MFAVNLLFQYLDSMRLARIKMTGRSAVYHCISRVVGGQRLLDDLCKEKLSEILRQLSRFCGGTVWRNLIHNEA